MTNECAEPYRDCMTARASRIRAAITAHPDLSHRRVAEIAGCDQGAVRNHRKKMEERSSTSDTVELPEFVEATLLVSDMASLLRVAPPLDAIITDPPYQAEFLPLYAELAEAAAVAIKPGGIVAVMCGQSHLPEIMAAMCGHLPYRWTLAYLTPGGQSAQIWRKKVNTFWKPILLFGGAPSWIGDVIRSDPNDNDKRFHEWGQSESGMTRLVEALTEPGDLVCDPFLGGGSTALACAMTGRRFIGCDIDTGAVATTRERLALE